MIGSDFPQLGWPHFQRAPIGFPEKVMNAGDPNPNFPTSRWLQACWIEPDQRGRGVLTAMIEFLDGFGSRLGWETLGLGVWLGNDRARTAYARAGFTALTDPLPSRKNPGKFYIAMSRDLKNLD